MPYCSKRVLRLLTLLLVAPLHVGDGSTASPFNDQFFRGERAHEAGRISFFRATESIG